MSRRNARYGRNMGTRWESGALKRLVLALRLQRRRAKPSALAGQVTLSNVIPLPLQVVERPARPVHTFMRPGRLLAKSAAAAVLAVGLGAGFAGCDSGGGDEKKDVKPADSTTDIAQDGTQDSAEEDLVVPDVKDVLSPDLPPTDVGIDVPEDPDVVPQDLAPTDTKPEDVVPTDLEPQDLVPDEVEPDVVPDVEPGKECYLDTDCPEGQECVGAVYCPPGMMCILPSSPGECQLIETPEGCKSDADCPPGEVCELPECPPGMFCIMPPEPPTGTCVTGDRECLTDAECPDGWDCVGALTCPDGAICVIPNKPGTCEPPTMDCYSDADCPQGYDCVGASSCPPGMFCILPAGPGECVELPVPDPQPASMPMPAKAPEAGNAKGVWDALLKKSTTRFGQK